MTPCQDNKSSCERLKAQQDGARTCLAQHGTLTATACSSGAFESPQRNTQVFWAYRPQAAPTPGSTSRWAAPRLRRRRPADTRSAAVAGAVSSSSSTRNSSRPRRGRRTERPRRRGSPSSPAQTRSSQTTRTASCTPTGCATALSVAVHEHTVSSDHSHRCMIASDAKISPCPPDYVVWEDRRSE